MSMIRFNHMFDDFQRLQREMDRMWQAVHPQRRSSLRTAQLFPPVNLGGDSERFVVELEVPGFSLDDLDLTVTGDTLLVKGAKGDEKPESASFHRRERYRGSFSRSIKLPDLVDAEKTLAKYTDGVLRVELPKAEAVKPRQISVQGG